MNIRTVLIFGDRVVPDRSDIILKGAFGRVRTKVHPGYGYLFGAGSIPVPDTSVSSVRPQYRHLTPR